MSEFNLLTIKNIKKYIKKSLNERKIVGNMKNNGNDNKKYKQTDMVVRK
jgi:hypothetical protein